ncbi:MAG: DUF1080 domain-containing protein [Cyclobacteriaceae bacterium]|nr:DUF1080 domain-containing protein [Cyclobacteriaceae bacterium]
MRSIILILIILFLSNFKVDDKKTYLFNGKDLNGWDTYVASASKEIPSPGINNDPDHVFSVVTIDGAPALRISGESFAGISTKNEFENYHLTIQFKWGQNKIPSFKDRKRDSGLLYHAVGPHGADARAWMRSQEFQIQEGDTGDYWGVAGGIFDVPATKNEKKELRYDAKGIMTIFSEGSPTGRRCWKNPDAEKPTGEWNTLDLYCSADSSVHVVNGVVVMRLYHSRQVDNGKETPLTKGKIQFQSEGCEIYYRGMILEPIKKIPAL